MAKRPDPQPPGDAGSSPPLGPPQRRLGPCPGLCGLTVMANAWALVDGTLQPHGEVLSPCFGMPHDCATAMIEYAARWQYLVRLAEPRRFP